MLAALEAEAARIEAPVALVRLLLAEDGAIAVTSSAITLPTKETVWRFAISDRRLDEKDPFFYHKTTRRQFFEQELERQKALTGCDEVVFLNSKGELTEGTRTNLFVELDGRLFTPALACGLLPGTLREELLDLPRAAASEAILAPQDLLAADRIYLGNSVRGLVRAELIGAGEAAGIARARRRRWRWGLVRLVSWHCGRGHLRCRGGAAWMRWPCVGSVTALPTDSARVYAAIGLKCGSPPAPRFADRSRRSPRNNPRRPWPALAGWRPLR